MGIIQNNVEKIFSTYLIGLIYKHNLFYGSYTTKKFHSLSVTLFKYPYITFSFKVIPKVNTILLEQHNLCIG